MLILNSDTMALGELIGEERGIITGQRVLDVTYCNYSRYLPASMGCLGCNSDKYTYARDREGA
jgi:hypothetical protein